MCGIFAAINTNLVAGNLISGLSALTYRGYDSAGLAVINNGRIERRRASGKLAALSDLLKVSPVDGQLGIAHTRWATHGLPDERNAHPHMTARVAVAHNGIVENYDHLRRLLEASGYIFESETDSETIAQLITYYLDLGMSSKNALTRALSEIKGSFGVVVIFSDGPQQLFAARKGSPLMLGKAKDGFYVSSDSNAFDKNVNSVIHLQDNDIACVTQNSCNVFGVKGEKINRLIEPRELEVEKIEKDGHEYFMEKEIFEQPSVFERTWHHYFNTATKDFQLPKLPFDPKNIERLIIVACGTSYFASMVCKYWMERSTGIAVDIDIASEYRYRNSPTPKNCAAIFVSQSGETADTLAALQHAKTAGLPCLSLVNVQTSTMALESDAVLPTLAGPEIGVASTKAFISQLTTLFVLTQSLKQTRNNHHTDEKLISDMVMFPGLMESLIKNSKQIKQIARYLKNTGNMLYLGRDIAYPLAEEGALKLKEISYIHAEAYPAGELKHGPLALVDDKTPIVFIAPPNELLSKSLSNLREVASRGGKIILISNSEGIQRAEAFIEHGIEVPEVSDELMPILYTLPLQLMAYHVALLKGNDVDQPRNLAKSVTVE